MSGPRTIVGFMPLLDCATLVVAAEGGFAAAEGLDLRLVRETSWANIRDRLIVGQFDAAHMLGPMVLASTLGIGHLRVPLIAPVALGLGGNAITVSGPLAEAMRDQRGPEGFDPAPQGQALARVVRARAARDAPPLVFAMVYPFSAHNYELRYWLAASGIDPDVDVRLVVIPPPLLVDALREGQIDGFCVGEPWSSVAVAAGVGEIVTTAVSIWHNSANKVLGMRRDWAAADGERVAALVRAVVRAALWCDDPGNRHELARLLAGPRYVGVPADLLEAALAGELPQWREAPPRRIPGFIGFATNGGTFPFPSHALWFYEQMVRWRQCAGSATDRQLVQQAYCPHLYRAACANLQVLLPPADTRSEYFFDGQRFERELISS
ncbi:MAG: CmpA/NrtA family ABC transporter substrate-binding protein [Steroidobacteraceae bacterium]